MRRASIIAGLLTAWWLTPAFSQETSCGEIIAERPNSSAARVCATKEFEAAEHELQNIEKKIVEAISHDGSLHLDKKFFLRTQKNWKSYRASDCGLESALGPIDPTATQLACESQMTTCRIKSLAKLLTVLTEGGNFSANEPCQ